MTDHSRFRLIALGLVLSAVGVACSLVASLDGYSDRWGKTDGGGADGGMDRSEAAPPNPPAGDFVCGTLELRYGRTITEANLTTGPYLFGLTATPTANGDALFVAGGVYPNSSSELDAGYVLRLDKSSHDDSPDASFVNELFEPTAIVPSEEGIVVGTNGAILHLHLDGGSTPLRSFSGRVIDLVADDGGMYYGVAPRKSATITFVSPAGAEQVRPVGNLTRLVLTHDALYAARSPFDDQDAGGRGLVRIPRDAPLGDAGTSVIDPDPIVGLAAGANALVWSKITGEVDKVELPGGDARIFDRGESASVPMGLGVSEELVFAQYQLYVRVFERSTGKEVCKKFFIGGADGELFNKGFFTSTVRMEPPWIYFTTSERVYALKVSRGQH